MLFGKVVDVMKPGDIGVYEIEDSQAIIRLATEEDSKVKFNSEINKIANKINEAHYSASSVHEFTTDTHNKINRLRESCEEIIRGICSMAGNRMTGEDYGHAMFAAVRKAREIDVELQFIQHKMMDLEVEE